jgi:membrane-bound lytic murein transglycosylase A
VASVDVAALDGWAGDDLAGALQAYAATRLRDWPDPEASDARTFFETQFRAVSPTAPPGRLTGYYEPVFPGSLIRMEDFGAPLYAMPPGLPADRRWASRIEIEEQGLLDGHEIVYLSDPVDAFFAQVQGSVRIVLPDGRHLRLGYSGRNGHPYRSVGAELAARIGVGPKAMTAQAIRDWCRDHPAEVTSLLRTNPSFVFFRRLDLPDDAGPIGTAGVPVSPMRSLAVDPDHVPLGTPVWIETIGPDPIRRLCIAQDTGSAIKGLQRGDLFCGTGDAAGQVAGSLNAVLRITPLVPASSAGTTL